MKLYPLLSLILIFGCTGVTGNAVKTGDNISVDYTGSLSDGTVFDSSVGGEPLTFIAGAGQMITGFDNAVIGMRVGDEKTVTLVPSEAYGDYDPELIINYSKSDLETAIGMEPYIGMNLYSQVGMAVITEINNINVTLDLNHPLAGKDLFFDIKLLSIN